MWITFIFLLFLITIETVELCYRFSEEYRSSRKNVEHLRGKIPNGLEVVSIGSGPGKAGISFDYCSRAGYNFCTAPQSLKYGFRILKRFSSKIKKNAVVIIIICPFSFGNNANVLDDDYSDRFYGILPAKDIDGYSLKRALMLRHPLCMRLLKHIKPQKTHRATGVVLSDDLPIIKTWKMQFDLVDFRDVAQSASHKQAIREKTEILAMGIDYCKRNGFEPVLVIPPIPSAVRSYFGEDFLKVFLYDNLNAVREKFDDVLLLDYYSDPAFLDEMFGELIFLNHLGREKFSTRLFDAVGKFTTNIDPTQDDKTIGSRLM